MRSTNGHELTRNVCLALLRACALACGIVLLAPGSPSQTSTVPSISLQPCEVPGTQTDVKEKALCGTYEVFEDRTRKSGRTIAIKILVFPGHGQGQGTRSSIL